MCDYAMGVHALSNHCVTLVLGCSCVSMYMGVPGLSTVHIVWLVACNGRTLSLLPSHHTHVQNRKEKEKIEKQLKDKSKVEA